MTVEQAVQQIRAAQAQDLAAKAARGEEIRFVLEARERTLLEALEDAIKAGWLLVFKLSTLFEGSEQEVSEGEFDLARFYLLRIPGIAFAELQQRGGALSSPRLPSACLRPPRR